MLKYFTALLSLCSSACMAASYGGAMGENEIGQIVIITGDIPDSIHVRDKKQVSNDLQMYELRSECPVFEEGKRITCLASGKSPLAGATYKITTSRKWRPCSSAPFFDKQPGEVYICIKGCNKHTPRIFYVNRWEC